MNSNWKIIVYTLILWITRFSTRFVEYLCPCHQELKNSNSPFNIEFQKLKHVFVIETNKIEDGHFTTTPRPGDTYFVFVITVYRWKNIITESLSANKCNLISAQLSHTLHMRSPKVVRWSRIELTYIMSLFECGSSIVFVYDTTQI